MAISFAKLRVLNPTRATRSLLWHVLSIGDVWRDEPEDHEGMDKAGLFLFRVKSGAGVLEAPGARFRLLGPTGWWLLDLGRPRRYVPDPGIRLVTTSVRFSGPGVEAWRDLVFRKRAALAISEASAVRGLERAFGALARRSARTGSSGDWRMHEALTDLTGVLFESQGVLSALPPAPAPVQRVLEAVQRDPQRDWRAAELTSAAGLGYSSLRGLFKASQGETLHEHVQRIRLDRARWWLTDSGFTVKEVAERMNFSSEFYFSRWFHREAGMTPSRFRTLARG